VVSILSLTNNHEPQFENQNNENEDNYEFKLPMPFPKGLNVNSAFGVDIRAFDVDIDNQDIDFTIEDPEGNFDVVFLSESVDNKKRYSIAIRTLRLLDLTEPTFFTITATVFSFRSIVRPIIKFLLCRMYTLMRIQKVQQ